MNLEECNYIAVTDIEGEVIAFIDLRANEDQIIQKNDVLVRLGYGEPHFNSSDGKVKFVGENTL